LRREIREFREITEISSVSVKAGKRLGERLEGSVLFVYGEHLCFVFAQGKDCLRKREAIERAPFSFRVSKGFLPLTERDCGGALYFCAAADNRAQVMKEKARSGVYILRRSILMLISCAAIFTAAFYCGWLAGKIPINYDCRKGAIAVYELVWPEETEAGTVSHKWRYSVERKTHQPRRIEKFLRDDPNGEYTLQETLIIEYPLTEEMRKILRDIYR